MNRLFWIIMTIVAVGYLVSRAGLDKPATTQASNAISQAPRPVTIVPPRPIEKVSLTNISWSKSGFGAVALVSFTIVNKNEYAVRDVEVECRFFGGSGTQIGSRTQTVYETVLAGKSRRVRELNFGFIDPQTKTGDCGLVSASG